MKPTMKEIANAHGVSINAVSLALNNKPGISEEMRIKILRTAEETGYLESREKFMRTFEKTNLCIMMQKKYSQDMNFYGRILYGVVEEAKKNGYDVSMNFFDDQNLEVPKMIEEHRVCGIVIIGKIRDENIDALRKYRIPLVLADHASLVENIDSILTDNKLGGFLITKYLIENGFRRIGFFGELSYSLSIKERYWGFKEALMVFAEPQLLPDFDTYLQDYSITEGIEEAVFHNDNKKIVEVVSSREKLPEAFVCSNDNAAISLMTALSKLGYKIPEDISVTGFDNIDMCEKVSPKLTTLNVNKEMMGKRAVQRLLYRISHKNGLSENTVIGVDLIERESVCLKQEGRGEEG